MVTPDFRQDLPAENQWDLLAEYGQGLENAFHALWVEGDDPEEVAVLFGVDSGSRVECGLDTLGTSVYHGHPEVGIWIGPHAPGWTHLFAFNLHLHPLGLPNLGKRRVFEIDYTGEVGPGLSPLHLYYDGEMLGDVTPPQEPGEPVALPEYQPLTEGLELGGHDAYDEDLHSYFCMMGRITGRFTDQEWWTATRTFYPIPAKVKPYDGPFSSGP
ncbi:hypothetical protein [Nonomuraea sp. NPDC002799]